MPKLISTIDIEGIEIVSTFSTGQHEIAANDGYQNWHVIGTFYVGLSAPARAEIIGYVSSELCSGEFRLYRITPGNAGIVSNSFTSINNTDLLRKTSQKIELVGGNLYQVQVRCDGPIADENRLVISNITMIDA